MPSIKELRLALGRNIGANGKKFNKTEGNTKMLSNSSTKDHLINGMLYKGSSTFLKVSCD